jgi:Plavaka transposase
LPRGVTLTGAVLATGKTHLTNFSGNKVMYAAYLTLGNIVSDVQWKINHCAYVILAYFPLSKFHNTDFLSIYKSKTAALKMPRILAKQLFHHCMSIIVTPLKDHTPRHLIDAEGFPQWTVTIIMATSVSHLEGPQ